MRIIKSKRVVWLIGLLAVLAVVGVACVAPPAQPAAEQPAAEEPAAVEPIRIGAAVSLSGKYARTGELQVHAYRLWEKQVNDAGGLLDRPVELIIYDDKSDPETAARLYERLITEDQVDLILGPYSSAVTAAVAPVTDRHQVLHIAPMAASDDIWKQGYEWSIQVITPASLYLTGAVEIAQQEGYKTVAMVGEDSSFPHAALAGARAALEAAGIEVVMEEYYPQGTSDFSSLVSKMKTLNPDAVFGGTYLPDAIGLVKQAKDAGFSPELWALTVGAAIPDFYDSLGEDAELIMGSTHWEPTVATPGNQAFIDAYMEMWDGEEPDYHSAGAYGAAQILQAAIEECQCLDNETLRDIVFNMDTSTVFGRYKVDETGAQKGHGSFIIQWQDGQKEIVWPFDQTTAEYTLPVPEWSAR